MTSKPQQVAGKRAVIGLCAALLAGCTASPQYPIRSGEAPGDGGLHMTERPRYPISGAPTGQPAPPYAEGYAQSRQAPSTQAPAPKPPPPAATDEDRPHALQKPASSVTSQPLTPVAPPQGSQGPQAREQDRADARYQFATLVIAYDPFAEAVSDAPAPRRRAASYGFQTIAATVPAAPAKPEARTKAKPEAKAKPKSKTPEKATHLRGPERSVKAAPVHSGRHHTRHGRGADHAAAVHHVAEASPSVTASEPIETPYETKVRPGERLATVAERVHVPKADLMALNGISSRDKVKPGTVIKIPYRLSYQVGQGDTVFAVSHRFGQDMDELVKLNGLKHAAELQPGQTLELPLGAKDGGVRPHAGGAAPKLMGAPAKLIEAELAKARKAASRRSVQEAEEARAVREAREAREALAARQASPWPQGRAAYAAVAAPAGTDPNAAAPNQPPVAVYAPTPSTPVARDDAARPAPVGGPVSAEMAAERPTPTSPSSAPWTPPSGNSAAASPYGTPALPSQGSQALGPPPTRVASLPSANAESAGAPILGRVRPVAPTLAPGVFSDTDVSTAGRGRFVWPLHGAILQPFGDRGPGQRNDGLDIAATPGESVKAAASGEVVYAGSSIPGFGNLILVKHPGGWVTAYAHLDRIEVRMRDAVDQGQEIGQAGQTGAVDRPQLHFEVRYAPETTQKARPVDPTLVLPSAPPGAG
jgi:murein DD-endopeptidase MepM/ murein hydrolase activator NlpD